MSKAGHEVHLYGDPDHELFPPACVYHDCFPHVDLVPEFTNEAWEPYMSLAHTEMEKTGVGEEDFICVTGAACAQSLLDKYPSNLKVEHAVAYNGIAQNTWKVFESYAWMHTTYGARNGSDSDGQNYDEVIYPSSDVPRKRKLSAIVSGDPYVLYLGRMTERKGVQEACEAAQRADIRLVLAGEGELRPSYGEYLGPVGPKQRDELLSNAKALLAPSRYIEPGIHVAIEAQMFGTPVISTDWGAFTEFVVHGFSGFRCRTLAEFVAGINTADKLDRDAIRERAISLYSMKTISKQYESYFERLLTLKGQGWYT
jgi:glycosyltransferase involved in cell wall biosynthesis